MTRPVQTLDTNSAPPAERVGLWGDWINRLFSGLKNDVYGDTDFDGRIA